MDKICEENKCMGCALCVDSCPKQAITLKINKYGYYEPVINQNLCINCGLCAKSCIANDKNIDDKLQLPFSMYKAYTTNIKERRIASSGGIFFALAQYVIANNGYVFGAAMDGDFRVYHTQVTNIAELKSLVKSKYVGSNMSGIYNNIKELLQHNNRVLFAGTPCQNYALKQYVGDNDNILFVDLICHGVNSYKILDYYINYLNSKYHAHCIEFTFRNKKNNYMKYRYNAKMDNGKTISTNAFVNPCGNLFGGRKSTKISCDNCPFAKSERVSDITLADYTYKKDEKYKRDELKNGVSLVLVNTNKGKTIFNNIENEIVFEDVTDYKYLKDRVNRQQIYTVEEKEQMLNQLAQDTGIFVSNNYKLTYRDKMHIKYGGPFTGNPIQLIYKIVSKIRKMFV